ncbi:MAG: hypothetical protein VB878_20730 [Pirellulaceae bacterium]|jgi:hypothetical protein|nr:hypothetical protein [Planctomycetaceae bacterium]
MPKILCISGIVVSLLLFVVFLVDLVAPGSIAPFKNASKSMDVVFVLCAAILGFLSYTTLREQE